MNRLILFAAIYSTLVLVGIADLAYHHPQLPDRVATHFNAEGKADGWGSKSSSAWVQTSVLVGVAGMLFGVAVLVAHLPASLINLPNKEHWFAPARETASRSYLQTMVLLLGSIVVAMLVALQHMTLRANLRPEPSVGSWPWILLGLGFVGMSWPLFRLYRRFRRP